VHLLRDLTYLAEEQHHDWAAQMKDLLLSMKEAVEQACAEGRSALHSLEVADWQTQYQAILLEAEAAQPCELSPPVKGTSQAECCAQPAGSLEQGARGRAEVLAQLGGAL
jgi:hypothetical protein